MCEISFDYLISKLSNLARHFSDECIRQALGAKCFVLRVENVKKRNVFVDILLEALSSCSGFLYKL